jgi:hypothetical protein
MNKHQNKKKIQKIELPEVPEPTYDDIITSVEAIELTENTEEKEIIPKAIMKGYNEICKYIRTAAKAGSRCLYMEAEGVDQTALWAERRAQMLGIEEEIMDGIWKMIDGSGFKTCRESLNGKDLYIVEW